MSPPEKNKPSKKITEAVATAPTSSHRTRSSSSPLSLTEILEGLKTFLSPQPADLKSNIQSVSAAVENRLQDMENSVQALQEELTTTTLANSKLQTQLAEALERLDRIEAENQQISTPPPATADPRSMVTDQDYPPLKSNVSKYAVKTTAPNQTTPTDQSTATRKGGMCLLTPISDNQGFQFLYLPIRGRKPFKEIRAELRKANINSGSVIDIHYPTSKVVAILVHNDFATKAIAQLQNEKVFPLKNFNPLDPKNLSSPQFQEASEEIRTEQMQIVFSNQINKTLDFLRPPVKLAVARDFYKKGWISADHLSDLVSLHSSNHLKPGNENSPFVTGEDTDMLDDTQGAPADIDGALANHSTLQETYNTPMDQSDELEPQSIGLNSSAGGGEPANAS